MGNEINILERRAARLAWGKFSMGQSTMSKSQFEESWNKRVASVQELIKESEGTCCRSEAVLHIVNNDKNFEDLRRDPLILGS